MVFFIGVCAVVLIAEHGWLHHHPTLDGAHTNQSEEPRAPTQVDQR